MMKKIKKYREVELETHINLKDASKSFQKDVEWWLEQNGFSVKDIIGGMSAVSLDLGNKEYAYDPTVYPTLYATFETLETDNEFNKRVADEKKRKAAQKAREKKEYERLKKEFEG